jgi:hypothetical protein
VDFPDEDRRDGGGALSGSDLQRRNGGKILPERHVEKPPRRIEQVPVLRRAPRRQPAAIDP